MIRTERLRLISAEPPHFAAMRQGDHALGEVLGLKVAPGWLGLEDHRDAVASGDAHLLAHPTAAGWWTYLFAYEAESTLVGVGGFKGEPQGGVVEIGYAIAPSWRGRGLAAEAARGLLAFALEHPEVRRVQAHTLPEANASTRILKGLGMKMVEALQDPEDGEVWRWALERDGPP